MGQDDKLLSNKITPYFQLLPMSNTYALMRHRLYSKQNILLLKNIYIYSKLPYLNQR